MYYLTITKNGDELCERQPFDDYSAAIAACAVHYTSRTRRSVLTFTTETINGAFARSYAELNRPEDISTEDEVGRLRYAAAVKKTNAFDYQAELFFLIESDVGVMDAEDQ